MKFTTVAQIVAVFSSLVSTLVFAGVGAESEQQQQRQQQQQQQKQVRRRIRVNEAQSSFPQQPQSPLLLPPPPRDIRTNGTVTAEEAATDLHVFGPVRFEYDHQHNRRLEKGGYIALFDDDVVDVERHALRLAKKLNKEATEIMTETIKAVYLKDLSDDDVAYVRAYPGVKQVDPNFQVHMFNMGSGGASRDLTGASGSAGGDMFASSSNSRDQIATLEQDDDDNDDDGDDDDSSSDSKDENGVKATALLTESQKQRQRDRRRRKKQQQMSRCTRGWSAALSWQGQSFHH
jgi:hypothetical protein